MDEDRWIYLREKSRNTKCRRGRTLLVGAHRLRYIYNKDDIILLATRHKVEYAQVSTRECIVNYCYQRPMFVEVTFRSD
jgi:hypothetical protein